MSKYPNWLATEDAVRDLFTLLGFDVQRVSIEGRQIDVLARRVDLMTSGHETWIIEVTTEKVGATKGGVDSQKLLVAAKKHENARLMIVSTKGFTDDQKATLKELGIITKRFVELEATVLPLQRYALSALKGLEETDAPDIGYHPAFYVEPELELRLHDDSTKSINADEWIDSILESPDPGICGLLGTLGSGKTSLLKRILERGISRFLKDPDNCILPLYIPLGRYKQHAGDLDQMMMAELRRAGIENYPTALVQHLLRHRRILILLDGLDEVHPIQDSNEVLETVTNILGALGQQSTGVLSCRRQFFESTAEEQAYFGSFTAGKLRDLNTTLSKLLRGHPSTYIAVVQPFCRPQIEKYLALRCNMSPPDVDKLFERYYGFPDLATTPVLLSMIATTAAEGTLDAKKVSEFPLIDLYEAYTHRWIERDIKRARLNVLQRERFSLHLADRMLWRSLESASWTEVSDALREDPEWGNNPLTQEEAELDMRNSGFLVRDLDNRWRFAHRSILEYFAAKVEINRLASGERPRHIRTDGYRLFLTNLLAIKWIKDNASPIPVYSWHPSRGEEVRANQWSLLAAASCAQPNESMVSLSGVGALTTEDDTKWRSTKFRDLQLTIKRGAVSFDQCSFFNSMINVPENKDTVIWFEDCKFKGTTIKFDAFPWWRTTYDAEGRGAIDVPVAVWDFSSAVEAGAKVFVEGKQWKLRSSDLRIFLEAAKRLKGKIAEHNFTRGPYASELTSLLGGFIRGGIINEDTSRQPHQLKKSSVCRELVTMLKKDPVEAQADLSTRFVEIRR